MDNLPISQLLNILTINDLIIFFIELISCLIGFVIILCIISYFIIKIKNNSIIEEEEINERNIYFQRK